MTRIARLAVRTICAFFLPLIGLALTWSAPGTGETAKEVPKMNEQQALSFARLALKGIQKEYPSKPADVLNSEMDVKSPREMHPAFYGSFDWHSAVHGHWMLAHLLRLFPELPENKQIRAVLAEHLSATNLKKEA